MNVRLYDGTVLCSDHFDASSYESMTVEPCAYCGVTGEPTATLHRTYPNGDSALVDIERDPMGAEFGAALYESYAADWEPNPAFSGAAQRACEDIEYAYYEGVSWRVY